MTHDEFLQQFGQFVGAPNGVQKLRELILQLAVQGELLPQNRDDVSASVLIEQHNRKKKELIETGELKKKPPIPPPTKEDIPYRFPKSWACDWLGNCSYMITKGATPTTYGHAFQDEGIKFIKVENVKNGKIVLSDKMQFISLETHQSQKRSILQAGDILFSIAGTIGETCVVQDHDIPANTNQALAIIRGTSTCFTPDFLKLILDSFVSMAIHSRARGGAMNNVSLGDLTNLLVPIPPLPEQHRIVAKVNELMSLCDQLKAERNARESTHQLLIRAVHHQLIETNNSIATQSAWHRIRDSFADVYSSKESIQALRSSILQLAIRGKLLPQDPNNDEPSSTILERIRLEKEKLVTQGGIKKQKPLPEISKADTPFELPTGWTWARFPELGEFGRGKSKHRPRNDPVLYRGGKIPLVQTGDVARTNGPVTTCTGYYNERGLEQSRLWPKGTMCITIAANIADTAILSFDACFPDSVVGFIPSAHIGNTEYFEFFTRTAKENLLAFAPSTAQKNINLGILETVLIPLPPKNEMSRIVHRVCELMNLCDKLEGYLNDKSDTASRYAAAIVQQIAAA